MKISKFGLWVYTLPNKLFGSFWGTLQCERGNHKWGEVTQGNGYIYKYERVCGRCKRLEKSQYETDSWRKA